MVIKLILRCLHALSRVYEYVINVLTRDNTQLIFHGGKIAWQENTVLCHLQSSRARNLKHHGAEVDFSATKDTYCP